jgi:hypothetical protein
MFFLIVIIIPSSPELIAHRAVGLWQTTLLLALVCSEFEMQTAASGNGKARHNSFGQENPGFHDK